MKNYKISYADKAYKIVSTTTQDILAETFEEAIQEFTKKFPNSIHPNIVVDPGLAEPNKYESNLNYKRETNQPIDKKYAKRPTGSHGWQEWPFEIGCQILLLIWGVAAAMIAASPAGFWIFSAIMFLIIIFNIFSKK